MAVAEQVTREFGNSVIRMSYSVITALLICNKVGEGSVANHGRAESDQSNIEAFGPQFCCSKRGKSAAKAVAGGNDRIVWMIRFGFLESSCDFVFRVIPSRQKPSVNLAATTGFKVVQIDIEVADPVVERSGTSVRQDDELVRIVHGDETSGISHAHVREFKNRCGASVLNIGTITDMASYGCLLIALVVAVCRSCVLTIKSE